MGGNKLDTNVFNGLTFMAFLFLGIVIGTILLFIEDYITERLEKILGIKIKKFKCKRMGCYTYEGLSWVLLMYIIILPIVLYYPIIIGFHNLSSYIGILFIGVYPILVMIFRKSAFSDNSIPSAQNPVYSGPNLVSGGPGYNPAYYWLFSFAIGGASTIWGFSMLNFPDTPIQEGLVMVFMGLVGQTVVLFPDKFNKISPVDTRTRKGLYFMTGVTFTIIICMEILSHVLNSIYG